MTSYQTLSEIQGVGRVVLCRSCEEVYLGVGYASYRMPVAAFRELARMIGEAVNHPALKPEERPRNRFSILDGGLHIGPNFGN
jgi:hypothetical protein